ncbi:MAG TPA: NUDIX hydrolase [Jatrophihabitans sp.]|nr:NUDIX hydrolase [Jatrophihabitans sp.]
MAPVVPRQAATVLLLRDGPAGIQTWLLRRVPKMAFAPGMSVFPGGGVDPVDATGARPATEASVAAQLGVTASVAGTLLRAAAREIVEETGVRLPLEAMRPWAHWITPEAEPRRYDTYFFVAAVPADGVAAAITGEASHADWISVEQALAEYEQGSRPMMPPTVFSLIEVARFASTDQVLAAAGSRLIRPIQPVLRTLPDGNRVADLGDGTELPLPAGYRGGSPA